MVKKQFEDRLMQGNQCVGRLLILDLAITTGSRSWEEAAKEYEACRNQARLVKRRAFVLIQMEDWWIVLTTRR